MIPHWRLFVVAVVWFATAASGMAGLWAYATTPGPRVEGPASWPAETRVSRAAQDSTLVVFLHPHCPCSQATLGELLTVLSRVRHTVHVDVRFYRPAKAEPGWEHTDLWRMAASIPGVVVSADDDGAEAGRFGAMVSGQALLYDAGGRLLFSGGITGARGHAGDNDGALALVSLIDGQTPPASRSRVFGCFLRNAPAPSRAAFE